MRTSQKGRCTIGWKEVRSPSLITLGVYVEFDRIKNVQLVLNNRPIKSKEIVMITGSFLYHDICNIFIFRYYM